MMARPTRSGREKEESRAFFLCPCCMLSFGQHQALRSVQSRFRPHERLLALHDDVHAVAQPKRILAVHRILGEELWQYSRIRINPGKTQIWNRGGHVPNGHETFLNEARAINPRAEVWFGGFDRPPEKRGIRVLGTPLGVAEYVRSQLDATEAAHQLLLHRIPAVQDLQTAWLLLLFCASSRATFYLRVCHPDDKEAFACQHDFHTWKCLSTLLGQRQNALPQDWGSLPFHLGGLGLRSAHHSARAAFWGSWADCLHIISRRHGNIARTMFDAFESLPASAVHIQAAVSCRLQLSEVGYDCTDWQSLLDGLHPRQVDLDEMDLGVPTHGWQFFAAQASERHFRTEVLWPRYAPTQQAFMRSQSGPFAGLPFLAVPSSPFSRFPPQLFRVLPLVASLAPVSRTCRCGRPLDVLGHHRAACSRAGVLASSGFSVESAVARVCREAGARVPTCSFGTWTCQSHVTIVDDWKSWLTGFHCSMVPTLVSPVRADGFPRRQCAHVDGAALAQARHVKQRTYLELLGNHGRTRLVVLATEIRGCWSEEARRRSSVKSAVGN